MIDKSCRNLLIRGVNWIGDGVMTLPAIKAIRLSLPETRISLLIKPWVSPLFEKNPNIDEIILYEDSHKSIYGKIKLAGLLRKRKFCSAILLQNAFDAALVAYLAGIKHRIGYNTDGRSFLLTDSIPLPKNEMRRHQIHYYLNLLQRVGIAADYSNPYIYLDIDERINAREKLKDLRRPILGINPGATYGSAKRWLPDRFAEISEWFIKDTGGSIVIFGAKSEIGIVEEIEYFFTRQQSVKSMVNDHQSLVTMPNDQCRMTNDRSLINLAGKTSLRELIALISECEVFVTNDSGPMHIAYAVRTPLVAIFGSTDPQLTGPPLDINGRSGEVLKSDLPCSPCFERTCKKNNLQCMYAIQSDDVFYGIKSVLPEKRAVFLDRDGTLNKDKGYINKFSDLHIFEDIDRLAVLKEQGFKLIGISNQSGIGRGIVNKEFVKEVNSLFIDKYGFDDFYYCPHHPDERCSCRKPEPEMLFRARARYNIDLKKSYIVGDKETDMLLAKAVGAKSILVQTGKLQESQNANFIAKNLTEAVKWILENGRSY